MSRCYFCKRSPNKYAADVPCCTGHFVAVNESTRSLHKGKRLVPRSRPQTKMTFWERVLALAEFKRDIIAKTAAGTLAEQDIEFAKKAGMAL